MAEVARLGRRQWYLANVAVFAVVAGYQMQAKGHSASRFLPVLLGLACGAVLLHCAVTLRDRIHDLPHCKAGLRRQLILASALAVSMNVSHLLVVRTIDWAHAMAWWLMSFLVLIALPSFAIATAVRGQERAEAAERGAHARQKRRKRVPVCVNEGGAGAA